MVPSYYYLQHAVDHQNLKRSPRIAVMYMIAYIVPILFVCVSICLRPLSVFRVLYNI